MEDKLATELLHEVKTSAKRWFIAFISVLVLWFFTIGIFMWYLSLPTEETAVVENEDGNANYVSGNMSGVINNGENSSSQS